MTESSESTPPVEPRRPSPMWLVSVAVAALISVAAGAVAVFAWLDSHQPIGEGELFVADADSAAAQLGELSDIGVDRALRHVRNRLGIEAVSLVDHSGVIEVSTSSTFVGGKASSPMLDGLLERQAFGAVAGASRYDLEMDGVVEWRSGDILYEVLQPLDGGGGLLLTYDVSELLERRALAVRVPPQLAPLILIAGASALAALGLAVSRARANRIYREMAIQAEYMHRRADDLAAHNRELEAAKTEVERALALAEEKNRIRADFVLMINHELRTPLTGVITGAQLLEESGSVMDASDRAILTDILRDGERLQRMIGQMLAVARVENRGLFVTPSETGLAAVCEAIGRAHRRAPLDLESGLLVDGVRVTTDTTTLSQLLASLVDNAYTHGARTVRIRCFRRLPFIPMLEVGPSPESALFFVVADDGPGIEAGFLDRAFEKFEKASRSSGTGLGLYLARMMAEAIGSSISVHTGDRGTAMAVAVPLVRAEMVA